MFIALAVVATACGSDAGPPGSAGSTGATITIVAPADGAPVPAHDPVEVAVEVTGLESLPYVHTPHPGEAEAETGAHAHYHVIVDGLLTSMFDEVAPKVVLEEGAHTIRVEVVDEHHIAITPLIADEVTVVAEP